MRHARNTDRIGRTGSHKRAMIANMLKALVIHGRIKTTIPKAKLVKPHADRLITLAKGNDLVSRRRAVAKLRIRFNTLTPKESRKLRKAKDESVCNEDRLIINKLFGELREKYVSRTGGYTRITREYFRAGDNATQCYLAYV